MHNKTDVDNCKRAIRAIEIEEYYRNHPEEAALTRKAEAKPLNSLVIGIDIPREERRQKITQRLEARINEGMIEEVKGLLDRGISADDLIYYGLEYKFVTLYVTGKSTYKEMFTNLETAIHQFAKRHELIRERHQLSHIYMRDNNYVERDEDRLSQLVPRAMTEWKNELLNLRLKELFSRFHEISGKGDTEEESKLMMEMNAIMRLRSQVAKDIGDRILSPRSKTIR